jgi:hypothetical protein
MVFLGIGKDLGFQSKMSPFVAYFREFLASAEWAGMAQATEISEGSAAGESAAFLGGFQ